LYAEEHHVCCYIGDWTNVLLCRGVVAMVLDLEKLRMKNGISIVGSVFSSIIREKYNRYTHAKIPVGGKMEKTAQDLIRLAHSKNTTLRDLLTQAIDMYGVEFCQRTFRTPYPQINVVLSDRMLQKLKVQNKAPLKVAKEDIKQTVQTYLDIMRDVDKNTAIECIKGGWPEGMPQVRTLLIERIMKRTK